MINSILNIFRRKPASNQPTELELNIIRVFAQGNFGLRTAARNVFKKYSHCNNIEMAFVRELGNPDQYFYRIYRDAIVKNCR